jgi:hypothetical protein
LCVSYRKLNAVTIPFTFPVTRCNDAVEGIGDAEFFLTMDYDAGYWQVAMDQASKEKTAFFTPEGKKHFNVMPMGATNAHPAFVARAVNAAALPLREEKSTDAPGSEERGQYGVSVVGCGWNEVIVAA